MSEKIIQAPTLNTYDQLLQNAAESKLNQRGLGHSALALLAAGTMAGWAATHPETASATNQDIPENEVPTLVKPELLPGYKIKVSKAEKLSLQNSAVKIWRRFKSDTWSSPTEGWESNCSGNYIKTPDLNGSHRFIITTAAHCLNFGMRSGVNNNPKNPKAVEISAANSYEYAIANPRDRLVNGVPNNFIAKVKAISISQRSDDLAFMSVEPGVGFDKIKPTSFKSTNNPKPGQEVAISSSPDISGNTLKNTTGTYLGVVYNYQNPDGDVRQLHIVGIKPLSPVADKCMYGASGSSAAINGAKFGPLSIRINSGYTKGKVDKTDLQLYKEFNSGFPGTFSAATMKKENRDFMTSLGAQTGVDTSKFSTICGYVKIKNNTISYMLDGFSHPVDMSGKTIDPQSINTDPVGFTSGK